MIGPAATLLQRAETLLKEGRHDEAAPLFHQALALEGDRRAVIVAIMGCLLDHRLQEEAVQLGQAGLTLFPGDVEIRVLKGNAEFRQGYFEDACATLDGLDAGAGPLARQGREIFILATLGRGETVAVDQGGDRGALVSAIEEGRAPDLALWSHWSRQYDEHWKILAARYMKRWLEAKGVGATRRPPTAQGWISVNSMRHYGNLAHTIGDYATAFLYARMNGLELRTPEWQGQYFFDLDDPFAQPGLPYTPVDKAWMKRCLQEKRTEAGLANADLFHPAVAPLPLWGQEAVRNRMRIRDAWKKRFAGALEVMGGGAGLVALHLRYRDLVRPEMQAKRPFDLVSFKRQLAAHILREPASRLLILSDDPLRAKQDFLEFRPQSTDDLPPEDGIVLHLRDFYLMTEAETVIATRGSFARAAVMIGCHGQRLLSPDYERECLAQEDPWQSDIYR